MSVDLQIAPPIVSPYATLINGPSPGNLSYSGQQAFRLDIPRVKTIIPSGANFKTLNSVKISRNILGNLVPVISQPILVESRDQPIVDDIGLALSPEPLSGTQPIGRVQLSQPSKPGDLPRNYEEALQQISKFSTGKSSKLNKYFKIEDLRTIAINLGLSKIGSKVVLVNRIVDAIEKLFGPTGSSR